VIAPDVANRFKKAKELLMKKYGDCSYSRPVLAFHGSSGLFPV